MRFTTTLTLVSIVVSLAAIPSAQGQTLQQERERLLKTYNTYKGYGLGSPNDVYQALKTDDRRGIFDWVVQALFIEIIDKQGNPTGQHPVTFVEAVHGVWGVRPGDGNGKHQFRMSVAWNPSLVPLLEDSSNLPGGSLGHVLIGVPRANTGDDNSSFNQWDIRDGDDVVTFRQRKAGSPSARLQLSMVKPDNRLGEIDIDVDTDWICHNRPANSDIGSIDGTKESHLVEYNKRFDFLPALQLTWQSQYHCKPHY